MESINLSYFLWPMCCLSLMSLPTDIFSHFIFFWQMIYICKTKVLHVELSKKNKDKTVFFSAVSCSIATSILLWENMSVFVKHTCFRKPSNKNTFSFRILRVLWYIACHEQKKDTKALNLKKTLCEILVEKSLCSLL